MDVSFLETNSWRSELRQEIISLRLLVDCLTTCSYCYGTAFIKRCTSGLTKNVSA